MIRGAYIEAIYNVDEWDYSRLTFKYWEKLLRTVSNAGNINYLLEMHPMKAVDENFTRPFHPFNCKNIGGCGAGTKRTPQVSCSIDTSGKVNMKQYWIDFLNKK